MKMIPYPQSPSSSFSFPLPNSSPISSSMNDFILELQVPPLPVGAPVGPVDPAPDNGIRAIPTPPCLDPSASRSQRLKTGELNGDPRHLQPPDPNLDLMKRPWRDLSQPPRPRPPTVRRNPQENLESLGATVNQFRLQMDQSLSMSKVMSPTACSTIGPRDESLLPTLLSITDPNPLMNRAHDGGFNPSYYRSRLDLPNFTGKEVHEWLHRAEQFMGFYNVSSDLRVRMAVLYLEEGPLAWYRGNMRAKGKPLSWNEFKKGLVSMYDNSKPRKVFDGIPQPLPLLIRKLRDTTPQSLSLTNAKYQSTTTTAAELITNEVEFVVSLESVEEKKLVEASQVQNVDEEVKFSGKNDSSSKMEEKLTSEAKLEPAQSGHCLDPDFIHGGQITAGSKPISQSPVELKPAEYDDASRNVMLNRMLKCMCFKEARKTFDEMSDRVVGSWVPLLTGYAHLHRWYDVLDLFGEGAEVFDEMLERRNVLSEVTDVAFTLDDGTGKADVIRWVNETSETDKITLMENGMYVVSWSAAFVDPMAFQLKHSRPGTLSLCLLVNDGYDEIKLDAYYRNVEFLVITGSGPYPQLENANIVFGTVLEGMGVVPAIVTIPTYNAAERIRLFNDFSEFIGDKRDQIARKMWTKLLKTVYISNCGELKNMCYGSPYAQCNGSLNASIITLQYLKNEIRQQIDFDPGGVCSMVPALIEVKYNSMIEGLAKALKFYPKVPELWIYAAAWEFDQKLNVSSTHQLMWSGLKAGPNPKDPWIEHLRMELTYLNKLKAQKIELLSTFQSEINSLFISADSKGTPWPFQKGYATPVGGPAYYITEPSSMAGWAATSFHALFYIVFMMSACAFLSKTWIEVFGSLARVVAKQLKEQHVVMPGHHESYLQKELNRYMYIAAVMLALTATTIVTSTTTISTFYVVLTIYYTGGFEADTLMDSQTNFDDNLANSDASMAAKRNLGAEILFEKISYIRKVMIFKCNIQGKHVVTATSMLECMIKVPRHTRAGAKHIANQTMAMNCWKDESYLCSFKIVENDTSGSCIAALSFCPMESQDVLQNSAQNKLMNIENVEKQTGEVRRILMKRIAKPFYATYVKISTDASIKEMVPPGALIMFISENDLRNPAVIVDIVGTTMVILLEWNLIFFGSTAESLADFFEIKVVKTVEPALKKQLIISIALMALGIAPGSWSVPLSSLTIFNISVRKQNEELGTILCVCCNGFEAGSVIGLVIEKFPGFNLED